MGALMEREEMWMAKYEQLYIAIPSIESCGVFLFQFFVVEEKWFVIVALP